MPRSPSAIRSKRPPRSSPETRAIARASEAASRASSAAGKAARRTHSVAPRRRPARVSGNTLRSLGKEWPKLHGACAGRMPRERSKPRHASSPFPKGTEGIACTQACASCRNTRSLSERSTKLDASSARGAKARGQGCHPQEGSQRARLSECGTHCAARVLARPADRALQLKRLFLSPSAFFEPAKKVRKSCKSRRPATVSRDTTHPQKEARHQSIVGCAAARPHPGWRRQWRRGPGERAFQMGRSEARVYSVKRRRGHPHQRG